MPRMSAILPTSDGSAEELGLRTRYTRAANRFLHLIAKRPVLVLVMTAVVSAFAVAQMVDLRTGAPRLLLDPSTDSMLSVGDPDRVFFERMKQVFGRSDTLDSADGRSREPVCSATRFHEGPEISGCAWKYVSRAPACESSGRVGPDRRGSRFPALE